jgi:hypothetical protein
MIMALLTEITKIHIQRKTVRTTIKFGTKAERKADINTTKLNQ